MAIKFETINIPVYTCSQEVLAEQREKIAKRVAKIDANLRKKFKSINRAEAEVWKKSRYRG